MKIVALLAAVQLAVCGGIIMYKAIGKAFKKDDQKELIQDMLFTLRQLDSDNKYLSVSVRNFRNRNSELEKQNLILKTENKELRRNVQRFREQNAVLLARLDKKQETT